MKEFRINDYITLKLENNKTVIYIKGELFNQCKYLLLEIPSEKIYDLRDIDSIDEAAENLGKLMEENVSKLRIKPRVEFWAHCSNLQAWSEYNYDTRLLHYSLAFPLLEKLTEVGDLIAKRVFKEEIAERLGSGVNTVVEFLFRLYNNYISRKNSEENLVFYNPYLEQLNRVIVDLVFYINLLPSTDKFDKSFFCNTVNKSILNHIMELGKSVMENKETKISHTFILALSIVVGNFITLVNNNLDVTSVMEDYLNEKFGLLTYFGICIVSLTKTNENNLNIDFDKFCNNNELIKQTFLEEILLFKGSYRGKEFISRSIDMREGNWGIIGYQIGSNLLYINTICSDVNIINGFILKIKEACNVLDKELNEVEQSEEHLKNKESMTEKKSLKKFLNLLPATKKKILNEGFEFIFKKMKKESIIFYDRSLRKWKLDLNKYSEMQNFP